MLLPLVSIGCVGTSSLIFRILFSFRSESKRNREPAAALSLPGLCAMVKLNHRRSWLEVESFWCEINYATDLLSVMMIAGFGDSRKLRTNFWMPSLSLRTLWRSWTIFISEGVKNLESYATEEKATRVDVNSWLRWSSVKTAYPAVRKHASVFKTNCFYGKGCMSANWQLLSKTALIWWNSLVLVP